MSERTINPIFFDLTTHIAEFWLLFALFSLCLHFAFVIQPLFAVLQIFVENC